MSLRYLKDSGMLFFHEKIWFLYGFGVYPYIEFEVTNRDNYSRFVEKKFLWQVDR